MTESGASYCFLPWLRRGVSAHITREDGSGPSAPRASFPLTLIFNQGSTDEQVTANLEVHGPGEVASIDPRIIVRTDPASDISNVESNYFPLIEFDQADFPWRYTPATATVSDRLRPWLVLIVLRDDEFERQAASEQFGKGLPRITVHNAMSLPKLAQSWAWAHVQITGLGRDDLVGLENSAGNVEDEISRIINEEPNRVVSRLLCARYLQPRKTYSAFVVPSFKRGRQAGLNQQVDDDPQNPKAWDDGDEGIELPVYFQWQFQTGEAGDFESLVRDLLPARPLSADVGMRAMDVSNPGTGLPSATADDTALMLEGALMSPASRQNIPQWNNRQAFVDALETLINRPDDLLNGSGDAPAIAPPLYGRWLAARSRMVADAELSWFDEINRDPRLRGVAGLGTQVIQAQQQQLMAAAWEQVDGILEANKQLRQAQLGCAVAQRLIKRDFLVLEADAMVQITAPILSRIKTSPQTISAMLNKSPIAGGALEPQFRRITRPLGPIGRKQVRAKGRSGRFGLSNTPPSGILRRMNQGELPLHAPPPRKNLAKLNELGKRLASNVSITWRVATVVLLALIAIALFAYAIVTSIIMITTIATLLGVTTTLGAMMAYRAVNRRRLLTGLRDGVLSGDDVIHATAVSGFMPFERGLSDRPDNIETNRLVSKQDAVANFQVAFAELADRLQLKRAESKPRQPANLNLLHDKIMHAIKPERTIARAENARLHLSADGNRDPEDCGPIMAAPEFNQPMYEPLRDLSQEWLLPGVGNIPPDTVSLLETNQRFIESYMLGLNHEMARELLWHEYPTDQRGTYFRQFWDVRGYAGPRGTDLHDIQAITDWNVNTPVGTHGNPTLPTGTRLVLLIRGQLLRRYPHAVIYASKALLDGNTPVAAGGQRILGDEQRYPIFRGSLSPDIVFLGFDLTYEDAVGDDDSINANEQGWFFIIEEQSADPRFGLNVDENSVGKAVNYWDELSWGHLVNDVKELENFNYIDLDQPVPSNGIQPRPHTPAAPTNEPHLAWHAGDDAGDGSRASDIAYITMQSPYRVAIHGSDMLPSEIP